MKINHVLVQTTNLNTMTEFLIQVTGLEEGFRPPFPFPGAWIYSEGKPILHLVETADNMAQKSHLGSENYNAGIGVIHHIALEGANYEDLIQRLNNFGINYTEHTIPLTKEHQVFVVGPDNIKLEMLFNENKSDLNL